MNYIYSTPSFLPLKPSSLRVPLRLDSASLYVSGHHCSPRNQNRSSLAIRNPLIPPDPSCLLRTSVGSTIPSNEGTVFDIQFEDFVEKDWSFLDMDSTDSDENHSQNVDRIISSGRITETSKVLISIGSEIFVDRVVGSSPCKELLVVHDSLFILACIKEKYDKVKCWQGELISVPDKWKPFDVVFLYFLPALPFELDQVLEALYMRCLPGARIVISHPRGRQALEQQQRLYPDTVIATLPERTVLQSTAANHSFDVIEFHDKPEFYLAVLRLDLKSD